MVFVTTYIKRWSTNKDIVMSLDGCTMVRDSAVKLCVSQVITYGYAGYKTLYTCDTRSHMHTHTKEATGF